MSSDVIMILQIVRQHRKLPSKFSTQVSDAETKPVHEGSMPGGSVIASQFAAAEEKQVKPITDSQVDNNSSLLVTVITLCIIINF